MKVEFDMLMKVKQKLFILQGHILAHKKDSNIQGQVQFTKYNQSETLKHFQ